MINELSVAVLNKKMALTFCRVFFVLTAVSVISCAGSPQKKTSVDSTPQMPLQQTAVSETPAIIEPEISDYIETEVPETAESEISDLAAELVKIIFDLPPETDEPETDETQLFDHTYVLVFSGEKSISGSKDPLLPEPAPPVIVIREVPAPAAQVQAPSPSPPLPAIIARPRPSVPAVIKDETPAANLATDPESVSVPEPELPEPAISPLPSELTGDFSRVVRATVGQLVEVPFRGTGWVFLGETGARRGISYDSRRLDPEGQSFIFRTELAGVYALKFYRQDFINDFIINDYVQVTVGDVPENAGSGWFSPPIDRGRVVAEPRWPVAVLITPPPASQPAAPLVPAAPAPAPAPTPAAPPVPAAPQPAPSRQPAPVSGGDEGVSQVRPPSLAGDGAARPPSSAETAPNLVLPSDSGPDVFIKRAREEFDAGRVTSAISLLDQFRKIYPSGSDEAWWLYGQCYEANSPGRNILAALDYYRRLIRDYPQSSRAADARRRISYLERYYINIQ